MARLLMIESWVQSTGRTLPQLITSLGHEYVVFTRDPDLYPPGADGSPHPVLAEAAEITVVDTNDTAVLTDAAWRAARRQRIDGVLTTCDYYLTAAASVAAELGLPGGDPDVLRRATRKDQVRRAIEAAGLPNAAFAVAATWPAACAAADAIGYPLVAKPVDLNSGTAVRLVADEAALKDAFWEVTGADRNSRGQRLARLLLLEELLVGPEVSVEAVTRHGVTTILGVTAKSVTAAPHFVETGHVFPASLPTDETRAVESLVHDTLAALGFTHGLSHTEVKLTADGPRVVEVNPRQGGGYIFDLVRLVTGANPLQLLVELALGAPLTTGTADAPVPGSSTVRSAAVAFHLGASEERGPRDNNDRQGHVIAVDPDGSRAGQFAAEAVRKL